ncbi:MAG: hypothetical protein K5790_03960 [Nitrosopumilus sp.]|uniref:hypothetical protein n=1 Tax=Nitrosopumilus sp. TaxID=2024843 RepID=UPI00247E3F9D|nr:hypothetical protein [Nitrosopumilus sp.]MCV0392436.1 hypothetical protein [Nitrosopumilus sp.]
MKKITAIFLSTLLLSLVHSMNADASLLTPMKEKEKILGELEEIKNNSEISEKTQKSIEDAITEIKKSLEPQLWIDESTLNHKEGKKVFDNEEKAIKKLDTILKDKKESDEIKRKLIEIIKKLLSSSKILINTAIDEYGAEVADEKTIKKFEKTIKELEKADISLLEEDYVKTANHYGKVWKQIQHILNEPHAKKMKTVNEGSVDLNYDKIDDVYIKIVDSGKKDKPIKMDIKIRDACVNGDIPEDAAMKMAFMGPGMYVVNERLTDEGFHVTNEWFKENDDDKQIDRFTEIVTFFSLPPTGDDMIQGTISDGSFDHNDSGIKEIEGQTGWEGSIEIKGYPGQYEMVLFFPLTSPTNEGDDCNIISAISIPFEINP